MAKKNKHGHHGGSWKVAYADFVTAMMALFLCLWLTSQDQKIKEAVERAFRNPFSNVTKESVGIIPNEDHSATYQQQGHFQSVSAVEMETMRHLSDDLSKLLKVNENVTTVRIDLTPEGLNINIFDRAQKPIFHPNTAEFTDYGQWVFSTLAWEISRYTTFHIEIEGHTESKSENGTGTHGKWDLSTERANAARRILEENGVNDPQIFKVSGFADTSPMPGYEPDDEINRRVTVLLKLKESVQALSKQANYQSDDSTNPATTNDTPKTESFMPLTKAVSTGGKPEFQVTVVSQANPAQGFQTLGQLASASAELHNPRKNCEPQLSVQRDGDRITHIRVQCNCGQTIELACVYDQPAK